MSDENKAVICDLCDGSPKCTEVCGTGAIRYGRGGNIE